MNKKEWRREKTETAKKTFLRKRAQHKAIYHSEIEPRWQPSEEPSRESQNGEFHIFWEDQMGDALFPMAHLSTTLSDSELPSEESSDSENSEEAEARETLAKEEKLRAMKEKRARDVRPKGRKKARDERHQEELLNPDYTDTDKLANYPYLIELERTLKEFNIRSQFALRPTGCSFQWCFRNKTQGSYLRVQTSNHVQSIEVINKSPKYNAIQLEIVAKPRPCDDCLFTSHWILFKYNSHVYIFGGYGHENLSLEKTVKKLLKGPGPHPSRFVAGRLSFDDIPEASLHLDQMDIPLQRTYSNVTCSRTLLHCGSDFIPFFIKNIH